jgi:hypothetical protein
MTKSSTPILVAIASVLALTMLALAVVPAAGADSTRQAAAVTRHKDAERHAHKLVNCLRTGGRVTLGGRCAGWGSGKFSSYVKPLRLSHKISNHVSWPWAKRTVLARSRSSCFIGHSLTGSTVDKRFAQVGLKHATNGENMGCWLTQPHAMVVRILRLWQSEKSYRGWHWRQLKSKKFASAGFGVAQRGRKSQLIVNFYGEVVH